MGLRRRRREVRYLRLTATMLRYRVASLLLPFFLLAPTFHGALTAFRWTYIAGLVALFASYVVATCLNDIFDFEIDRINHPQAADRPLVSGQASPRHLVVVAIAGALVALGCGLAIGWLGVGLIVTSLLLNVAYSMPPVRLCARPVPAPAVLAFAYVALPYGIGLASAGRWPDWLDARVVLCFMVLFAGRMLLKDFRDRRGDAAFGKRTFLLAYGKHATLVTVLACVIAGDAILATLLPPNQLLAAVIQTYFVAIGLQLYHLWRADHYEDERRAIAMGARMGNAVVLTLLGSVLLQSAGASATEQAVFVVALAAMFWLTFAYLSTRTREAVAAYRG